MTGLVPCGAGEGPDYGGIHSDIVALLETARHAAARSVKATLNKHRFHQADGSRRSNVAHDEIGWAERCNLGRMGPMSAPHALSAPIAGALMP